ncbi:hypothetical protein Bpfe_010957 [Biomphalaria pfeifferi]|uniref:Uncharacterized protein n=1 Tax=Biomphalaria pfeifferi TaxID=112525 RepID=A0AAD8FDJ3_BIOPF|nr:hypothetical protein Bpfe_010957 [Biomphalaria pfeifferi]
MKEVEDPDTYLFEIKPDLEELVNSVGQELYAWTDEIRVMSTTWKKSNEETCTKLEKKCTSVKEVTSPVVKTMDMVEETLCDQRDTKDEEVAPSLDMKNRQ